MIPPRSRLLRPEPRGLGTGAIESLRSYLLRLAKLHYVTPTQLVFECVPAFRRFCHSKKVIQYWKSQRSKTIKAFEDKTCRRDLSHTTLTKWENLISKDYLYARRQKWCPCCVKEDPYERLLWTINCTEACPIHECTLQSGCSKCGYVSGIANLFPAWEFCKKCGHNHGDTGQPHRQCTERQLQESRQLHKWLERGPYTPTPETERIKSLWDQVIFPQFQTKAEACKVLGVSTPVVYLMVSKSRRSRLVTLLGLSYGLGIDLIDLLTADLSSLKPSLKQCPPVKSKIHIKTDELKRRIDQAMQVIPENERTARAVAQFAGISSRRLILDYPELSQSLKTKRKIDLQRQERRKKVLDHMVQILREEPLIPQYALLKRTGVTPYPCWRKLEKEARLQANQTVFPGM